MAAREGQGLQIAVIIFAMLTIILAVTTGVFYTQAETNKKAKAEADGSRTRVEGEKKALEYKLQAYRYVLGMQGGTEDLVKTARFNAGDKDDPEVNDLMAAYTTDMATYGAEVAADGARNYRTLPQFLLASIARKNASVSDANDLTLTAQAERDSKVNTEKGRADTAELAVTTARDDLGKERAAFEAERARISAEKDKLASTNQDNTKKSKAEIDAVAADRDKFIAEATVKQAAIDNQKDELNKLRSQQVDLFENPDGRITWVNQKQQIVWINLGLKDKLMRQTNFSVYDHDENGVANAEEKGSIEVLRILGDHLAEARIVITKNLANPILPEDIVHTPAWSPGQQIHFALAGRMDANGDGKGSDDFDLVKSVIRLNGGAIDAEVTDDGKRDGKLSVNTRYLVLGTPPDERSSPLALNQYTTIRNEADGFGTTIIDVQRLLEMMGWKAEERTVGLMGTKGSGEFRERTPLGKKPAAPAAEPAAGEAPAAPAGQPMPPAADPFAAPAADPFAAPDDTKPMPKAPAAEADPFAP